MTTKRTMNLGTGSLLGDATQRGTMLLPADHLMTHGCVVGMTGSGKTGFLTVMAEEALRIGVPVLILDVKGDLPNLLLSFPTFDAAALLPWMERSRHGDAIETAAELASAAADSRRDGLLAAGIGEEELRAFVGGTDIRIITPGSSSGEPLHILSCLERRSTRWDTDVDSARAALGAAVSLVLRLLGRDDDPASSREHALLSVLAERRLASGESAELGELLRDVMTPPIETIGALEVETFLPRHDRFELAAALNTLIAAPTFATWRTGTTLDVGEWLAPKNGRTQAVIVSVAHLDDQERALVLGVLLEEVLTWVRSLSGSQQLRAMVLFDEVYGFLPPHPANPPTKRPMVALMKQARAFGVGVVIATQNPMDLDYRALGNAGLWCIGRLQTDADRARVVEGLEGDPGPKRGRARASGEASLTDTIKQLPPRWFVMRDAHANGTVLLSPRHTMSHLHGPMTRADLREARVARELGVHAGRVPAGGACTLDVPRTNRKLLG